MKALYFASVRERVGVAEEDIFPPREVSTVSELMRWLASRGEGYAEAFANARTIRAAVDKAHASHEASIASAKEVAFFPPMTGG